MEGKTFDDHIKEDVETTAARALVRPEDGLIVTAIKLSACPFILWNRLVLFKWLIQVIHFLVEWIYLPILRLVAFLARALKNWQAGREYIDGLSKDGLAMRNLCLDIYVGGWTTILVGAYIVVVRVAQIPDSDHADWFIVAAAAIVGWRLYEICMFLGILHSTDEYRTPAKMRAILNTLWHYVEVVLIFATLFVVTQLLSGDEFVTGDNSRIENVADGRRGNSFSRSFTAPLYFSVVTITTLGYGDISPKSVYGKTLVCLQVSIGLYLLVIILQRAMSAERSPNSPSDSQSIDGRSDDTAVKSG